MKKIQPVHTNKLMQKWEEDRLHKHMERKINSAKASGASNSSPAKQKGSPAKGSPAKGAKSTSFGRGEPKARSAPRKHVIQKEKLDEEISTRLQQVLRGVARQSGLNGTGSEKEGSCSEVAEEISEEPFVTATTSGSQDRYGRPLSRAPSNANSVDDDETMKTSFTRLQVDDIHDEEHLTMPVESSQGPQRNLCSHTNKVGSRRNQAILSQSIAQLQLLVNAKIEDLVETGRKQRTKIPSAPSQVRPVSARTKAATRIPGLSPLKGKAEQRRGTQQAMRSSVIMEEAQLVDSLDMESVSLTSSQHSSSSQVSPSGSPSKLQRTASGGSGGSSGIRDSTEIGLGQLREAAVADSLMDVAGVSEFMNAHRSLMNTEVAETSTDQLLSTFLQDSSVGLAATALSSVHPSAAVACPNAVPEAPDGDDYADDDFEDFDEEEDHVAQGSDGGGSIRMQAKALYGSLHELQALMKSPHVSRRPTMTDADSVIPEEDSYMMADPCSARTLSAMQLSHACSILEDTFRRGGSIPAFDLEDILVQKL